MQRMPLHLHLHLQFEVIPAGILEVQGLGATVADMQRETLDGVDLVIGPGNHFEPNFS